MTPVWRSSWTGSQDLQSPVSAEHDGLRGLFHPVVSSWFPVFLRGKPVRGNRINSFPCAGAGACVLETCPCLLDFISSVVKNPALDPAVTSFTLKLTGLLAASADGFKLLQVDCTHTSRLI